VRCERVGIWGLCAAGLVVAPALAATGASELRMGFARRVITPALGGRPVYLAGFGHNRVATGVHDDLYARAVAVSDGRQTVALVSVDLIGLSIEDTKKSRELLAARTPQPVHLLVASTHNHEGPDTLGLWGPSPVQTGADPAYRETVQLRVAEAAAEALSQLEPARLVLARASTPGLIEDGRLPRVIDDELVVARAVAADGRTLGTAVVWSSHPEALGGKNTLITADYPYYLLSRLESKLGGTAVFFAGSIGGLMTPLRVKLPDEGGREIPGETFEHARAIGERAADRALESLAASGRPSSSAAVEARSRRLWIPLGNTQFRLAYSFGIFDRPLHTRGQLDVRRGPYVFQGRPVSLPLGEDLESEVDHIRIGDLEILGVPGEIYPELVLGGIQDPQDAGADFLGVAREPPLKSLLGSEFRAVIGLANDEIGYIVPRSQWDERPPFAYGRKEPQYGEVNSTGDGAAAALAAAVQELLREAGRR
jgi:hypothetical protein